jgi:V/A-type H+-transporting ATPase subunit C
MYLLLDTDYGPDIEEHILQGRTAANIDAGLKDNMARAFRTVLGFASRESNEILITLLGRWDIFNIKTVIRGRHMRLAPEAIMDSVLPAARLDDVALAELTHTEDVKGVMDTLLSWGLPYGSAIRAAAREYGLSRDLALVELALDRHFAQWATRRLRGGDSDARTARVFLGTSIDAVNLMTCLRLLNADIGGTDYERYFLPGGRLVNAKLYADLSQISDVDEFLGRLKRTPYGAALDAVAVKYLEHLSISVFERALEEYVVRRAIAAVHADALGVGVLISYLWLKANEVTNLRIVVKGISVGMPADRMREELIVV